MNKPRCKEERGETSSESQPLEFWAAAAPLCFGELGSLTRWQLFCKAGCQVCTHGNYLFADVGPT